MTTPADKNFSDIKARVDKAAQRRVRAASAAKRRERVERAGLKIGEFSASFGIDDSTTFRWIAKGIVRAVQIGGLWIIPVAERDRILTEGAPKRGRQRRAVGGRFTKDASDGAAR